MLVSATGSSVTDSARPSALAADKTKIRMSWRAKLRLRADLLIWASATAAGVSPGDGAYVFGVRSWPAAFKGAKRLECGSLLPLSAPAKAPESRTHSTRSAHAAHAGHIRAWHRGLCLFFSCHGERKSTGLCLKPTMPAAYLPVAATESS